MLLIAVDGAVVVGVGVLGADEQTYSVAALLYAKKHGLKFYFCDGKGEDGKVTLPDMKAFHKACTCDFCGFVEVVTVGNDGLMVFNCNECKRSLCDMCRAVDDDEQVDDCVCQACYDARA